MDKQLILALIGTIAPLAASGVLLLSYLWGRGKTNAEATKANAESGLVNANTLTVVIDGLKGELARVNERLDEVEGALEEERKLRITAQDLAHTARMEANEANMRFELLAGHHRQVLAVATAAHVLLPPAPPVLEPYLRDQAT